MLNSYVSSTILCKRKFYTDPQLKSDSPKPDSGMCIYLLYFAWADQRVQPFYNYHIVSSR